MIIPPSYLFKSVYSQHWEEPEAQALVTPQNRSMRGLLRPAMRVIGAMLSRHSRSKGHHHFGVHAYD